MFCKSDLLAAININSKKFIGMLNSIVKKEYSSLKLSISHKIYIY